LGVRRLVRIERSGNRKAWDKRSSSGGTGQPTSESQDLAPRQFLPKSLIRHGFSLPPASKWSDPIIGGIGC
jgi:hypothetical protein